MIRRRPFEDEDDENQDRWLISYADLITLLFAFFVVMYATSTINLNKYRDVSNAVVTAFQGTPGQTPPPDATANPSRSVTTVLKPLPLAHIYQEKKLRDQESVRHIGQLLANDLHDSIEQKQLAIYQNQRGLQIEIQSQWLFDANGQQLSASAQSLLKILSLRLTSDYRMVQVEGHTDGESSSDHAQWEKSALQAARVADMLVRQGFPAKQLMAAGFANTQPLSVSQHAMAHALNSRITVRLLAAESTAQEAQNLEMLQEISPAQASDDPLAASADESTPTPPSVPRH